jgi:hypothetical protein
VGGQRNPLSYQQDKIVDFYHLKVDSGDFTHTPCGSMASLPQELCVSEDCDDDDVVALKRWRSLRTAGSHSRLQVAMAWRESVIVHLD